MRVRIRQVGWCAVGLMVLAASREAQATDAAAFAMVGGRGTDADGYPRQTADKRVALRLLRARRFNQLDAWLVALQAAFEADYRKEYWPSDALGAFGNADPTLAPLLDAWLAAKPDSYMALAARGIYRAGVGWRRRSGKWASETQPESFRRMRAAHVDAFPDLDEALERHPSLVAAHLALINIAMANSAPLALRRRILDQALVACPDCFQVRVAFMGALSPRWGGTYRHMRAFAEESTRTSTSSKLRRLVGYIDEDTCNLLSSKRKIADALEACNRAIAVGETSEALYDRAYLMRKSNPTAALADIERAIEIRPQQPKLVDLRASMLGRARDFDGYGRDIALLRELDPLGSVGVKDVKWAAQGLAYEADRRRVAGLPAEEIALLERSIALDPDQRDNYLRLDAALARAGELPRIPSMWMPYLARHPKDARAHLERAGALHHLGQEAEAIDEAATACRLGEVTGCAIAARGGSAAR